MSIKDRKPDKGKLFTPTTENSPYPPFEHPVFCLKYLVKDHHLDKCEQNEKIDLIDKMQMLSQMTWQQIQVANRHKLGSEKIERQSLKFSMPSFFNEDATILALRFSGMKAMIGIRNRFIFHIICLDRNFTAYSH